MANILLDPIFNLQTVPPLPKDKSLDDTSTILTQVSIETARPIVLTQDLTKAGDKYVYLPSTASISIHGDEVTVCGKLSFPSQNVVIFARVLGAEDDGANPACISVDGAPLVRKVAQPEALPKGVTPENKPGIVPKVAVGKPGWLLRDHPEMNGEDGDPGSGGNVAGNVWICCHKTSFGGTERKLTITAKGGPGGDGQPGQDGADGGSGHNGKSLKFVLDTYELPERGTDGGDGGNGGQAEKAARAAKGDRSYFTPLRPNPKLRSITTVAILAILAKEASAALKVWAERAAKEGW